MARQVPLTPFLFTTAPEGHPLENLVGWVGFARRDRELQARAHGIGPALDELHGGVALPALGLGNGLLGATDASSQFRLCEAACLTRFTQEVADDELFLVREAAVLADDELFLVRVPTVLKRFRF